MDDGGFVMLFKIALTCTVCFVFSLIAFLPYKEKQTWDRPYLIDVAVVSTAVATFAAWFVFCVAAIWFL